MSRYTHWACFDCRKSFHDLPSSSGGTRPKRCPDCGKAMTDMGVYFEPPRRRARRAWAISRLLSENGYRFQTEGNVAFIRSFILLSKRPAIQTVKDRIEQIRKHDEKARGEARLKNYKRAKQRV